MHPSRREREDTYYGTILKGRLQKDFRPPSHSCLLLGLIHSTNFMKPPFLCLLLDHQDPTYSRTPATPSVQDVLYE